ncbi:hypothetical protein ON010_g7465 [Phytophthora cinnamomi]|nr:hypothetical protein ON010_g7465 [Phytophthora cinnamomi]
MADHVASYQADASAPPGAGPADTPKAGRKNFTAADDLTLLRCVNLVRLWEAAVGIANGIMKTSVAWSTVSLGPTNTIDAPMKSDHSS